MTEEETREQIRATIRAGRQIQPVDEATAERIEDELYNTNISYDATQEVKSGNLTSAADDLAALGLDEEDIRRIGEIKERQPLQEIADKIFADDTPYFPLRDVTAGQ